MIICVGEILADLIGRVENGKIVYERYGGGAPFNVACGLKKLGANVGFVGSVGKDIIGDYLTEFAQEQNFNYLKIKNLNDKNTTLAFVELDAEGERKFSFFRCNTADFLLPVELIDEIVEKADLIHLGSLPLSQREGRNFADMVIEKAKNARKKISFDVNYREDIFESAKAAVEIYLKYVNAADVLKLSEDELPLFAKGENIEEMLINIAGKDKKVFVTLGANGSIACFDGKIYKRQGEKVNCIDATGAGDAFFAGALYSLQNNECDVEKILDVANACGSAAVKQKGAYPLWNKKEVLKI